LVINFIINNIEKSFFAMIDLHTHSNYSDGLYSPTEIVAEAYAKGVRCLALTDHDTCEGIPEFLGACKEYPDLHPIIGCELSARFTDDVCVHILALNVKNPEILTAFGKKAIGIENFQRDIYFTKKYSNTNSLPLDKYEFFAQDYSGYPSQEEAMDAIKASGATPVLAHPYRLELNDANLRGYSISI
jgi:predicted metal-dependent phosphoesterase TrpH